jgi:hypothetical protein
MGLSGGVKMVIEFLTLKWNFDVWPECLWESKVMYDNNKNPHGIGTTSSPPISYYSSSNVALFKKICRAVILNEST